MITLIPLDMIGINVNDFDVIKYLNFTTIVTQDPGFIYEECFNFRVDFG